MAYRALYREWRPQAFSDMVGQEHVCQILKNALAGGRVAHAYLFCGPRGTGKTSTAKILAKALNCVQGPTPEPCNQCSACQRVATGEFLDVLEIDGASNRGIDEVRELREKVQLSPAEGRFKVYIIDEVHMLTTEAFNALLKTLEEPPERVIFVFATTEAHKIPLTILSRCQRLDFHRLPVVHIMGRLQEVARGQGVEVEERTLLLLAKKAEGSLRDAISFLDQCISFGAGKIDHDEVLAALGVAPGEALAAMVAALANRDVASMLKGINQLLDQGRDPRQLVRDLIDYFRNLLLVKVCQDPAGLVEVAAEEAEILARQSDGFSVDQVMVLIETLAQTEGEVRWSSQPRVLLEVLVVKLVQVLSGWEKTTVPTGVEEKRTDDGPEPVLPERAPAPLEPRGKPKIASAKKPGREQEQEMGPSLARVREGWSEVLNKLPAPVAAMLRETEPVRVQGDGVTLAFAHSVCRDKVVERYQEQVERAVEETFGSPFKLRCILKGEKGGGKKEEKGHSLLEEVQSIFGPELVKEVGKDTKDRR